MVKTTRRKKSPKTLLKEIDTTTKALFEEQFDEDTVPVDMGEIVKLLCVISDYLKAAAAKEVISGSTKRTK